MKNNQDKNIASTGKQKKEIYKLFNPKNFADRMSDLRNPNGNTLYTYRELSKLIKEKTKVSISYVQLKNYENGDTEHMISINNLLAIADYYDVSIDYLIGRTNSKIANYEDRYISEKLGMSEKTIKNLTNIRKKGIFYIGNNIRELLDTLLSIPDSFGTLAVYINDYFDIRYRKERGISKDKQSLAEEFLLVKQNINKQLYKIIDKSYLKFKAKMDKRILPLPPPSKPLFNISKPKNRKNL